MDKISIKQITNASVYIDGNSYLGRASEVELPSFKTKMNDFKPLGLFGSLELPAGIDKMELKIKWNSFYAEVLKAAANPFKTISLQIRSSMETYTSEGRTDEEAVTVFLTGSFKEKSGESFKQHEPVGNESTLSITYYKLNIGGEDVIEIDVMSNIFKIEGEDVLANYRANIGDSSSVGNTTSWSRTGGLA